MGNNNVNLNINSTVEVGGQSENVRAKISVKERLSSWALWVSVLGLSGLIMEATGIFRKLGITDEAWNAIITAIGAVLSAFGIVNNPTDKNGL